MRVTDVRHGDGLVTLLFAMDGLRVLPTGRRSPLRLSGAAVFAAIALGLLNIVVAHASATAGVAVWLLVIILLLGGGLGALAAQFASIRREKLALSAPATFPWASVDWARSEPDASRVSVTLGTGDGGSLTFEASGMTGARMASCFAQFLIPQSAPAAPSLPT
ncbi:hypothetical protein [Micromonospora endolithica]|uniref:Uncharacterized protein n=1 Tax=Micromonospora endolithica TaxID=230091 RepID=A0A3A9ZQ98_9ACTN|nr:hypothetical protein [Micromonospora endolithica]RKN50369.1 hypothetical protein D7223_00745 [Micromonospora endolithica]TWJ20958.1 hypothetical protein JD76_01058 [Micromonospora endolithica]